MQPLDKIAAEVWKSLSRMLFFLPTIPPHEETVNGRIYNVREQMIGIIGIVDCLTTDDGRCRLADVRRIFAHWWPAESKGTEASSLAHFISDLIDEGLLLEEVDPRDRRRRTLALTDDSKVLLANFHARRSKLIAFLLQQMPDDVVANVSSIADRSAQVTWKVLRRPLKLPADLLAPTAESSNRS